MFGFSNPGPLKIALLDLITPVATPLSLLQSWAGFNQRETNYHETAVISFQDGSLKLYEFPRIQKLKYLKGISSEQYRKVFYDYMPWAGYQNFLPDFAEFLIHANEENYNQPTMVSLMHSWCYIPPPNVDNWCAPNNLPEHTNQRTYFVYASVPKDNK